MQSSKGLFWKWIAGGGLALLALGGCAVAQNRSEPGVSVSREHFLSSGVKILVDVYRPAAAGAHPRPPVLVLHGAGGMLFDGPEMARVARALAKAGFTAYQVHYFDRTHTWFSRQAVLLKLFPTWRGTVHDAVEWVRIQQPGSRSVGIFGYSLGAFAAIEEARVNPAVGAVVEQAGGFWHAQPEGPTRHPLPPLLLLHGLEDQRVPFAKYTKPLLAYLQSHHETFTTHFFPSESHQFSEAGNAQVRKEAVAFFRKHLDMESPLFRRNSPPLPPD